MNGNGGWTEWNFIFGVFKRLAWRMADNASKADSRRRLGLYPADRANNMYKRASEENRLLISCLIACLDGANGHPVSPEYFQRALRGELASFFINKDIDDFIKQIAEHRNHIETKALVATAYFSRGWAGERVRKMQKPEPVEDRRRPISFEELLGEFEDSKA